jgi:two-component system chemotaxis response regulator CheB
MAKKILVIDDSALMRRVISDIINSDEEYEVEAIAKDGLEGFEMIVSNPNRYSAVILDINMPKMNGLELLEKLQKNRIEQTVIVVSTVAKEGAKETIRALELGAFDFVTKPENYLETKGEVFRNKIKEMLDVATASSANTVTVQPKPRPTTERTAAPRSDFASRRTASATGTASQVTAASSLEFRRKTQQIDRVNTKVEANKFTGVKRGMTKLVALACSTGGPKTLQKVVPLLPKDLDAPMLIVQHMPVGFTASLASRLNEMSALNVKEAQDGEVLVKGNVYIAPGGKHIRVVKTTAGHEIRLSDEPPLEGLRPCANVMFQSLGRCNFDEVTCVVLTGMGADGTKGISELAALRKKIHVIAQDENTCVVYGMPKAIAQTGLVDEVVPVGQIAEMITKNVGVS